MSQNHHLNIFDIHKNNKKTMIMWNAITDDLIRADVQFQVVTNFNQVLIGVLSINVYNLKCRHDVTSTHKLSQNISRFYQFSIYKFKMSKCKMYSNLKQEFKNICA